jgi:hypothetical protein
MSQEAGSVGLESPACPRMCLDRCEKACLTDPEFAGLSFERMVQMTSRLKYNILGFASGYDKIVAY